MSIPPCPDGNYYCYVHPYTKAMLVMLGAKEKWKLNYREERMRRKGYPEHQIRPTSSISTWEGMRFVERKE